MYDRISLHNDGSKNNIKVFVITGNKTVGVETAYKYKDKDGKIKYNGFLYKIFKIFSYRLKNKYTFDVTFGNPNEQNYDQLVNDVNNGKYDLIVGGFYQTIGREKLVNFTIPLMLNANSILHYKNTNTIKIISNLLFGILKPIMILIILGLIFGYFFHKIEPKKSTLKRTILKTISAFFGNMDYFSDKNNISLNGMIFITITMIVAFTIIHIVQARLTTLNISLEKDLGKIDVSNLSKYKFLGFDGWADTQKLIKRGARVKILKNMSIKEGVDYYLKNYKEFNGGLITSHTAAWAFTNTNNKLLITYEGLGLEPESFIINKNKPQLLEDINQNILDLKENGILTSICNTHIKFIQGCFL